MKELICIVFKLCVCNTSLLAKELFSKHIIHTSDTTKVGSTDHIKTREVHLQEVIIRDRKKLPKEKLAEARSDYSDPNLYGNTRKTTVMRTIINRIRSPVTILYSLFSKRAKNMYKLQGTIEADYREAEIDYRYTAHVVTKLTGLTGKTLLDFMAHYRPSYEFISKASDYDLILFIKKSYQQYHQNTSATLVSDSPKKEH